MLSEYSGPIFSINKSLHKPYSRAFDYDLSLVLEEFDRILIICSREISKDPTDIESFFFRSLIYYYLGQTDKADKDIEVVLKLTRRIIQDLYYKQGKAYADAGRFKWANVCFEIANRISTSYKYLLCLANIDISSNDQQKAIQHLQEAISIDPNNIKGYRIRSKVFWERGFKKEAIDDLLTCIKINPNSAGAYAELADYIFSLNNIHEEAICLLRFAVKFEPANPRFLYSLANYYSSWSLKTQISEKFLSQYRIPEDFSMFYDNLAFDEKINIAQGYYSKAFVFSFETLRTDIDNLDDNIRVSFFVGSQNYLFDVLKSNSLFFSNVTTFPDKVSDCPLLSPLSKSQLAICISYNNIRVRCCSSINDADGISRSLSMWDRFANGHKGVCYTINISKKWLVKNNIYGCEINYSEEDVLLNAESPEQVIKDGLFIKHIGYKDENEFRLIAFGKFKDNSGEKFFFNGVSDDSVKIESIYLGAYLEEIQKQEALRLISSIPYKIDIFQMVQVKSGKLDYMKI